MAAYLGKCDPAIYGSTTAEELDAMLHRHAKERGYSVDLFYTNVEGEAINRIYRAVDEGFNGLVMNPAGFSYAGYALKDCIKGAGLPYVEINISNIHKRGSTACSPTRPRASLRGSASTAVCSPSRPSCTC